MARPGITYADVVNAAMQIKLAGKPPTIERIRTELGTGSSTTIANYLRQWKESDATVTDVMTTLTMPNELVAMTTQLWNNMVHCAEEKMRLVQQELDKYKKNNQRWQQLYHQWLAEKKVLMKDKNELEEVIHSLRQDNLAMRHKLQEKQVRVAELHYLHKQAQENFEELRKKI